MSRAGTAARAPVAPTTNLPTFTNTPASALGHTPTVGSSSLFCLSVPLMLLGLLVTAVGTVAAENTLSLSALGTLLPPFVRENVNELVKVGSATCEALPLDILFSSTHVLPQTDVVEFTHSSARRLRINKAHKKLPGLSSLRSVVLYVPGWWNTPTDESSTTLVSALLTKHPVVLLLDTRSSFCGGYVTSATRVKPLSRLLYSFIKNLHREGVPLSSIHLIGFSLGAHVAGLTGSLVQKGLNGFLGRITALDPAKPCFNRTGYRLERNDAEFVHVIHSSSGVLGLEVPIGHADVYLNGVSGKHPECEGEGISLECDHAQAWKMYAASVLDETALIGPKCDNWNELVDEGCSGQQEVLGYSSRPSLRGLFLYKSENVVRRREAEVQVYNPFDFLVRWQQ